MFYLFLFIAILIFGCIGIVYYVNYEGGEKQKEDAVLVQYVIPETESGGLAA